VGKVTGSSHYKPVSEASSVIGLLDKLSSIQEVTPELAALVKRITIYDGERIEIQFAFSDELARLNELVNTETNDYMEVAS